MKKKITSPDTEHILIPVAWLKRLIEMAQEFKSYDKQHFVGYIESAQWLAEWHRFIDALADGKDAEQFFLSLESDEV